MTEPQIPTQEVYANEAKYMEAMQRHSKDFDKLVESVPEDRMDIRDAMQSVYNIEPDRLLDRDKLAKLKEQSEPLFKDVSTFYKNFLEEMLGLNK